jgi:hypothetical protein
MPKAPRSKRRQRPDPLQNLKTFVERRANIVKKPKKPKSILEEIQALQEKHDGPGSVKAKHADATVDNINGIRRKWIKYEQ